MVHARAAAAVSRRAWLHETFRGRCPPGRPALFLGDVCRSSYLRVMALSILRAGANPHIQRRWLSRARHPCLARSARSEEHTSELQSLAYLVCRLLLEK